MRRFVIALAVLTSACSGPERPLIDQFFAASRLRDRTALEKIATVIYEPRERGIVTTFDVLAVDTRRDGGRERKSVTIAAPVTLPDGRRVPKTLAVTLDRDASGRWIVTAVNDSLSRP